MAISPLLSMQAPAGMPLSSDVEIVSDPILPGQATADVLAHFFEEIYDLRAESHLSRLLNVLLGDAGVGGLRKQFTYSHLSQVLNTSHFYDIDRLFADVLGFRRFLSEGLILDPYVEGGTVAEWEAVLSADASYRNRVAQFIRGVNWGPTLPGMFIVSSAVLGYPVRIYESYHAIDDEEAYDPGTQETVNEYGDLEQYLYGQMDTLSYGELEGLSAYLGRSNESRTEFIVRPLREITAEEQYHLTKTLSRLKPVGSMLTIDPRGVEAHIPVVPASITSPSSYWSIRREVVAKEKQAPAYQLYDNGNPIEQPRPVFNEYAGEEWYYNSDVLSVGSYALLDGEVVQESNFERVVALDSRKVFDFPPEYAMTMPVDIARGRAVRDGVLAIPPMERGAS